MAAMTAHEAFVGQRRRYIGGTDIAAITGISPWSTPLSVYLDKIGESEPQTETLAMRRGRYVERFIAREFIRTHPDFVVDLHPEPIVVDFGFPAGASLDGLVRVRRQKQIVGVFEAKSTAAWNARGFDAMTGDMPDQYFVQCQWYMRVADLDRAYLCVDAGEADRLRVLIVERDDEIGDRLVAAGAAFWQDHVVPRVPPKPNGSSRDGEIVGRLHPTADASLAIMLDGEAEDLLSVYLAAQADAKSAKERADEAKQCLQLLMGDADKATVGEYIVTWRNQSTTRLDSTALKAAEPDVWQRYAKTTDSRVFKTRERKAS